MVNHNETLGASLFQAKYFRCVSSLRLVLATLAAAVSELVSIAAALLIVLVALVTCYVGPTMTRLVPT